MEKVLCEVVAPCFVDGARLMPNPNAPVLVKAVPGKALRPVEPETPADNAAPPVEPVEIPADWESSHHRTIIALAQRILPGEQRDMTKDEAVAVIKAEIEKRANPAA